MPSVYDLKPRFQRLLMPLVSGLHSGGVTANQVTVAALVLSFGIGAAFWHADDHRWLFLALPAGLLLRMALNAIDGMIARTYQQQTKLGEVLNEIGDVVSDLAIYLPLIKYAPDDVLLVVVFLVLCPINEFAGFMGRMIGQGRRYDGPMGKSDRALVFGLYGLLAAVGIDLSAVVRWMLVAMIVLILVSTVNRIRRSLSR
jgi:CDP-diacylglycerol--glycerol-3-phosphate 3-phosphatidyltransferase